MIIDFLDRGVPVPFVCKMRPQRILAIAKELSKGQYDIVVLQEVCMSRLCFRLKIRKYKRNKFIVIINLKF